MCTCRVSRTADLDSKPRHLAGAGRGPGPAPLAGPDTGDYLDGVTKTLLIVPLLLVSLPWGAQQLVGYAGADAAATSQHLAVPHASSPAAPLDVAERETGSPTPCGMMSCADMVGCTGAGTAVGAKAASLLTWTVAAPDDHSLVLEFQTATRTAVPPPPKA